MEVLTVIAAALAFAGGEAAKTVVAEGVKDAYRAVKGFLSGKYPQIDLTPVEKAPQSKPRQDVLIEDLTNSGATRRPGFYTFGEAARRCRRGRAAQGRPGDRRPATGVRGRLAPHQ